MPRSTSKNASFSLVNFTTIFLQLTKIKDSLLVDLTFAYKNKPTSLPEFVAGLFLNKLIAKFGVLI
jgi:hypothetical protein